MFAAHQPGFVARRQAPGTHLRPRDLAHVGERARARRRARQFAGVDQADQVRPVVVVARPEDVRGLEHQERQARFAHQPLGRVLGALVVDPGFGAALRHVLAQRVFHQVRVGRHAGGVHEARHPRGARRRQQARGAADVGFGLRGVARAPVVGVGGGVEDGLGAGRGRAQRVGVAEVAAHRLGAQRRHGRIALLRPRQAAHADAVGHQFAHQVLAKEAGGAGDEDGGHGRISGGRAMVPAPGQAGQRARPSIQRQGLGMDRVPGVPEPVEEAIPGLQQGIGDQAFPPQVPPARPRRVAVVVQVDAFGVGM